MASAQESGGRKKKKKKKSEEEEEKKICFKSGADGHKAAQCLNKLKSFECGEAHETNKCRKKTGRERDEGATNGTQSNQANN